MCGLHCLQSPQQEGGGQLPTVVMSLTVHPFSAAFLSLSCLPSLFWWVLGSYNLCCLLISESASGRRKLRQAAVCNGNSEKNNHNDNKNSPRLAC